VPMDEDHVCVIEVVDVETSGSDGDLGVRVAPGAPERASGVGTHLFSEQRNIPGARIHGADSGGGAIHSVVERNPGMEAPKLPEPGVDELAHEVMAEASMAPQSQSP